MPTVSSLMLDTVVHALRFCRLKCAFTAIRTGLGLQAHRCEPLRVALSQVGYFFVSAGGLCVPGSNRDAAGAKQRWLRGTEAASRAAFGHLGASGARVAMF